MTGVARQMWQVARQLSREHLLEHVLPLTKRLAQVTRAHPPASLPRLPSSPLYPQHHADKNRHAYPVIMQKRLKAGLRESVSYQKLMVDKQQRCHADT